jgi:hypothetical protein
MVTETWALDHKVKWNIVNSVIDKQKL